MRPGEKIQLKPLSELLGVVNEESAMDIEIREIHSFKGHPFRVSDDEKMQELVESIKANGVLSPVLIRPDQEAGGYEMVSGHRRMHASMLAGLTSIPAIIREMTDDEAVIAMVDANIQREELLPSEKAFAYKMKMEAMKRQAGRPRKDTLENNSTQFGRNLESAEILANEIGESKNQIRRYIRLTFLIPDLLSLVDQKRLQFTVAVEISYIDQLVQKWLFEYIRDNGAVKPNQIAALRFALENEVVDQAKMIAILNNSTSTRSAVRKVVLKEKKLKTFFPAYYTSADMEQVILKLLTKWKEEKEPEV